MANYSIQLKSGEIITIPSSVLSTGTGHAAVTVTDTTSINLTLSGQDISGNVLSSGVDHQSLGSILGSTSYYHLSSGNYDKVNTLSSSWTTGDFVPFTGATSTVALGSYGISGSTATFSSGISANNASLTSGLTATTGNFSSSVDIDGNLDITSGMTATTGNYSGGLRVSSGLTILSTATFSSSVTILNNLAITSGITATTGNFSSSVDILGNLDITSGWTATTGNLSGGLNVTSGATIGALATMSSNVDISGNLDISSGITATTGNFSSSVDILGNLDITSGWTATTGNLSGGLSITSGITATTGNFSSGIQVLGGATITALATLSSNATVAGNLEVSSGINIKGIRLTLQNDGMEIYWKNTAGTAIYGNYITSSNLQWWSYVSGKAIMTLDSSGNLGIGTTGPTSLLDVAGDTEIGSANAFYLGDPISSGSWRIIRSGNNLQFQRRESSSWVSKGQFTT